MNIETLPRRRRVKVMFGDHPIAQYVGDEPHAARYEAAMCRRFPSLRVTSELIPNQEATRPN